MKKLLYYSPYIPLLGILFVISSSFINNIKICIWDDHNSVIYEHFYLTAFSQSIGIVTFLCFLK
jgi:hypothetical protein